MSRPWEPVMDVYRDDGKYVAICRACPLRCVRRCADPSLLIGGTPCGSLAQIARTMESYDGEVRCR